MIDKTNLITEARDMIADARSQARIARAAGDGEMAVRWEQCADMWQRKAADSGPTAVRTARR